MDHSGAASASRDTEKTDETRQKAKGKRQKAKGRRRTVRKAYFCLLSFPFCLLSSRLEPRWFDIDGADAA